MEKISKWLGVFRDVKAYVRRTSENKGFSQGKDELNPKSTAEDQESADNGKDDDLDAFVNDDPEERQLAEATIISEDTAQSSAGVGQEGDIDGQEDQTGLLEGDDTDLGVPEATGVAKTNGLPKNRFAKKARYAVGGIAVGVLALAVLYIPGLFKGRPDVDEPRILPVQIYLESIDGGTQDVLYFDRFLILLEDDDARAYLSLSLSVIPSSKAVYAEIAAKRAICRAVIYEVLKKAVSTREKFVEAKSRLPQEILEALDQVLDSGAVEKVDLSEFLVV